MATDEANGVDVIQDISDLAVLPVARSIRCIHRDNVSTKQAPEGGGKRVTQGPGRRLAPRPGRRV